jgi:hypothetical protein
VVVLLPNQRKKNMSLNIEDARSIVFELAAMALTDGPISEEFYEEVMLRRRELLQFIDHQHQVIGAAVYDQLLDDPHP